MTGKNKNWYNVENSESEKLSVDLRVVIWEKESVIENVNEISTCEARMNESDIFEAKSQELEMLRLFNTYQEIEDKGQKTISTCGLLTTIMTKLKLD